MALYEVCEIVCLVLRFGKDVAPGDIEQRFGRSDSVTCWRKLRETTV